MTDIFKIEQEFQTLKKILPLISSPRLKIEKTSAFIEALLHQDNQTFLKAYAEILPIFFNLILNTQFVFTPIVFIDRLEKQISALGKFKFAETEENIIAVQRRLVNQKEQIIRQIASDADEFTEVTQRRRKVFYSSSFVNIPMVESEKLLSNLKSNYSTISKLFVEIAFVDSSSGEDKIEFHQHFNDDLLREIRVAVAAAKNSFEKLFKIKIRKQLNVKIHFENNSVVSGMSFLCGLTLQVIFELMKLYELRTLFTLPNNVAISASIDDEGRLKAVSENNLKSKIEACFYSNLTTLILSKENETTAKAVLNQIQSSTKIKKVFNIVAAETIHDILIDRRLVHQTFVPASSYLINKIWKRRRPIAASIFLFLLLVIGKMLYGPLDKNPVDYKFEGNFLILKNQKGETLYEKKFAFEPGSILGAFQKPVAFYDLNKDGVNEIFWIEKKLLGNLSSVRCFDLADNKTLWLKELRMNLDFPNDPVPTSALFAMDIIVGDIDLDSIPEIYFNTRLGGYFPSVIIKAKASTGEQISAYIHDGNFANFEILDLDDDGRKEFLFTGTNNTYKAGVITVLDPANLTGYSPHLERHKLNGVREGCEKKYILVPRTIVGQKLEKIGLLTSCNLEDYDLKKQRIRIAITDLVLDNSVQPHPTYYIHFNFDLEPIGVSTSTSFEYWADVVYQNGELDFRPDHKYLTSTLEKIVYLR